MKIALAIPTNRGVKAKTVESLLRMVAYSKLDYHIIVATEGYTVSENRNYIVAQALQGNCSYLLMVDDDMIFPEDTLERLLEANKAVVGVDSHSRMLPLRSTVELLDGTVPLPEDVPTELFQCKAVGGGVLLIDLAIFAKMTQPFFSMETDPSGWTLMGEDSWFCREVIKAGYEVWCEPRIKILHIGEYLY